MLRSSPSPNSSVLAHEPAGEDSIPGGGVISTEGTSMTCKGHSSQIIPRVRCLMGEFLWWNASVASDDIANFHPLKQSGKRRRMPRLLLHKSFSIMLVLSVSWKSVDSFGGSCHIQNEKSPGRRSSPPVRVDLKPFFASSSSQVRISLGLSKRISMFSVRISDNSLLIFLRIALLAISLGMLLAALGRAMTADLLIFVVSHCE